MEPIISAALFVTVVGVLFGLVCLIKPLWWVKKRWQAALLMVGSFLAFGVLNSIPVARPAGVSEAEWKERVRVCVAAHAVRACPLSKTDVEAARAQVAKAASATPRPETGRQQASTSQASPPPATAEAAFLTAHTKLIAATEPCDRAIKALTGPHGRMAGYNDAAQAEDVCWQVQNDLIDVRFSDPIPEAAQQDLNDAVRCFSTAYRLESGAMKKAVAVFDSSAPRPSRIAEFRADFNDAEAQRQECATQYAQAMLKHGFLDAAHRAHVARANPAAR